MAQRAWRNHKNIKDNFLTPQLNTQRVPPGETRTKKVSLGRRFNGAPMAGCPLRYHRRIRLQATTRQVALHATTPQDDPISRRDRFYGLH